MINAASFGLLTAMFWRWTRRACGGQDRSTDPVRRRGWLRLLPSALGVLGGQLGSPGGWLVGLRTVDRRTGRRVALWRTPAVTLARVVTEAGRRRLTPASAPISESEREQFVLELRAIRERYADDSRLQQEALGRLYEQRRVAVDPLRWLPVMVGSALIDSRLRRRLAPTVVVVSRRSRGHSP